MKTFRTTAILLTGILCCISCTEHKPAQQKAQPTIRQATPGPEKTQIKATVLSVKEDSWQKKILPKTKPNPKNPDSKGYIA